MICFVPNNGGDPPKIFIRTLLYSTSERGQYVQNMFMRLQRQGLTENFDVWAYGDKQIVRGSGLFADKSGVETYHHFLLPKTRGEFYFSPGEYTIMVFAETVDNSPIKIFEHSLYLHDLQLGYGVEIYFDWESDKQNYYPHADAGGGLPNLISPR